jgi:CheY-like chemotaxis protein
VFVVDHRMPGKTGLELVRQLAGSVAEAERPQVIMMTRTPRSRARSRR